MDRITPIAQWRPAPKAILRRIAIATALTALGLQLPAILTLPLPETPYKDMLRLGSGWSLLATAGLVGVFAIEDLAAWRRRRREVWQLTAAALIYDGPEGHGQVALSDIKSLRKQWLSRVVVTLRNGQSVVIRDLAQPAEVVAQIKAAQAAL